MTRKAPAFELDPRLAPARAVRRAAAAQFDHALAALTRGDAGAAHETRKVCKKLRSLLRLIRPLLGRGYLAENARLRDTGRALSRGREALVLVETADRLFGADAGLEPLARCIREWPRPETAVPFQDARQLLETGRQNAGGWPLRRLSAGNLMIGLLAGYRRARRAYQQARRSPTPLALHEWRKQAKYHGYQAALLSRLWPDARTRINRLKKLSDLLGEHHDLHVLAMQLRRRKADVGCPERLPEARKRIRDAQAECTREALALGKLLLSTGPLAWLEAPVAA